MPRCGIDRPTPLQCRQQAGRREQRQGHDKEPVAVVLASDPHVAEEAVHLITAEYDELPAVYDEVEAVSSKAIVHEALKPAGTFPDLKHLKGVKIGVP